MHQQSKKIQAIVPGRPMSVAVLNGDIGAAIRAFKRQTKDSNVLVECYERRWFESDSKRKRLQLEKARYIQSVKE